MSERRGAARSPWAVGIATVGGVGNMPWAPGTAASVLAAAAGMLAQGLSWPAYAALCCTVSAVGIWAAGAAEQTLGQHDDSRIVIDEVAGTLCALASVDRANLLHVALATALFRVLDIVKPWPLRELDRRVTGGLGVMLDDVVAGIAVALVFAFLA